jgi:mannosylglycoprotein endo-beta-mannosidase
LDSEADAAGLEEDSWAFRYYLEDQLLNIYRIEEEFWRQRGRVRWSLQGDANTAYFHAVANGRRRKYLITSLVTDHGPISDKLLIQQHVYAFYKDLLGSVSPRLCGLAPDTWEGLARVSQAENLNLALTYSDTELFEIVKGMKTDTAPGPDGFPVAFFQKCWQLVKHGVLHILNDFILGRIDISRLNYGVLSLSSLRYPGQTKFRNIDP